MDVLGIFKYFHFSYLLLISSMFWMFLCLFSLPLLIPSRHWWSTLSQIVFLTSSQSFSAEFGMFLFSYYFNLVKYLLSLMTNNLAISLFESFGIFFLWVSNVPASYGQAGTIYAFKSVSYYILSSVSVFIITTINPLQIPITDILTIS